ncbi:MAG: hypothetical protein NZ108_10725, partial [Bacteroidia bacterium]|nr:hypothetical protein [Bacteroidia bacterium]
MFTFRVTLICLSLITLLAQTVAQNLNEPIRNDLSQRKQALSLGAFIHTYGIGIDIVYEKQLSDRWETILHISGASQKDKREYRIESL